jgi:hypothetical protein
MSKLIIIASTLLLLNINIQCLKCNKKITKLLKNGVQLYENAKINEGLFIVINEGKTEDLVEITIQSTLFEKYKKECLYSYLKKTSKKIKIKGQTLPILHSKKVNCNVEFVGGYTILYNKKKQIVLYSGIVM